jgi:hypothetical protein
MNPVINAKNLMVLLSFILCHNLGFAGKKRVHTFSTEDMPWDELKKEHVQNWRQLYLWLDSDVSDEVKRITGYETLPKEKYDRFTDATDFKLLPGATTLNPTGFRKFEEYTLPLDHIPGLVTHENFNDVIPLTYTTHLYKHYADQNIEIPKKILATAALGGFKYMERHLIILRPVLYKWNKEGRLVKKSLNLAQFYKLLLNKLGDSLSEIEKANLVVPERVTFKNIKKITVNHPNGDSEKRKISQPHLIAIRGLANNVGLEVRSVAQDLAIEASDQLVQQDLRMFFYSVSNMAYWVNRHRDKHGLHHDVNKRQELNFIEEVLRLLETRHSIEIEGQNVGLISAYLKEQESPGFLEEIKEYLKHKNPKKRIVRNKAVERNIRKACKKLGLPCQKAIAKTAESLQLI